MKKPVHMRRKVLSQGREPGVFQKRKTETPQSNMLRRLSRAPRPAKSRSVRIPVTSMPPRPATSKPATMPLAWRRVIPLACLSTVGPQSKTAKRMV